MTDKDIVEKFKREAKEVFENEVKPQIKNAMKQTAIEWFLSQMPHKLYISDDVIQKAIDMEKENLNKAYNDGKRDAYKQDDVPSDSEYVYQKYGI